jgi:O-acetylhomoserine (thiol)-lyase
MSYRPDTLALHAGQQPDPTTGARAVPLYQTTSYVFKSTEHAANLFALKEFGNIYTRIMNPTTDVFEQRIAALEGGTGALALASGMAAMTLALLGITQPATRLSRRTICTAAPTSSSITPCPNSGRTVAFVIRAIRRPSAGDHAEDAAIFAETVGNPKLDVPDFEALAAIAREAGVPLMVDNTVGVGLVRPLGTARTSSPLGDEIHRRPRHLDRWRDGRFGGKFNWNNGKYPEFTEPDPSYHGLKYLGCVRRFPRPGQCRVHHQAAGPPGCAIGAA